MIPQLEADAAMIVLYIAVFVGALLAFEGLRHLLSPRETDAEARNRRMSMLRSGKSPEETYSLLLKDAGTAKRGSKFSPSALSSALKQSGFTYGIPGFLVLSGAFGVVVYLLAQMRFDQQPSAILAVASAFAFPFLFVHEARRRRQEKLERQLPEALDQMARGLKVGHPLNVTVSNVAAEMADPVGTEFGLIEDQIAFGDELVSAFDDFADRTGSDDARYMAVCVGIQHGSGGNLARVLQVLAKVMRDRATMRKKISAISAEGRLSAFILSVLPIGIFLSVHTTAPTFYGDVWHEPLFHKAAILSVSLVMLQAFVLYRLVNFKF
ncbi:MAG: type II secretion system F family protein [Dinoroseobacter sp.]|nr:type II secretion system F family protein [Dinoroseobacter sp.]